MVDPGFTDAELERLHAFRRVAAQVRDSSIIDQGLVIQIGILRRERGRPPPDDLSGLLPAEQFRSLCMSIRLTYMNGEGAHFFSVSGLLGKGANEEQRECIRELRAAWRQSIEGPAGLDLILDGKRYTAPELFELWLNGVAFHQDAEKTEEYEHVESYGAFGWVGVQVTALKLAGRIMDLDDVIAHVLGEEQLPRIQPKRDGGEDA